MQSSSQSCGSETRLCVRFVKIFVSVAEGDKSGNGKLPFLMEVIISWFGQIAEAPIGSGWTLVRAS